MALKNINPTKTESWKNLESNFEKIKEVHMKSLFQKDKIRKEKFTLNFNDFIIDFSKNRVTEETLNHLIKLAEESQLKDAINKYFNGDKINKTENRAVLHTALRNQNDNQVFVNKKDVMPEVKETLNKIKVFTKRVVSGEFKGYSGKAITDVVNIGIGGSDLGPRMVVESLQYYKNNLNTHFVSNIDGDHVSEVLKELNPETTLFIIVSKTFTTQETITNATTIKKWFLSPKYNTKVDDIQHNFVAVSTNLIKVKRVWNFRNQYFYNVELGWGSIFSLECGWFINKLGCWVY